MSIKIISRESQLDLERLFETVFSASEGEQEGRLIGKLASTLAAEIDDSRIVCIGMFEGEELVGSVFFTHLETNQDIQIFMLAPVAVATDSQRKGISRSLIEFGLKEMRNRGVSVVVTYGDPGYYSGLGFQSLSEDFIKAPLKLSMPEGWLGQSLSEEPIPVVDERPEYVAAFNDPTYW